MLLLLGRETIAEHNVVIKNTSLSWGQLANYDKDVVKRIEDIEQLENDTKGKLFFLIDNVIQNYKTKKAFAK